MRIWKVLSIAVVKYMPIIFAICVLVTIILYFWIEGLFIADLMWGNFLLFTVNGIFGSFQNFQILYISSISNLLFIISFWFSWI